VIEGSWNAHVKIFLVVAAATAVDVVIIVEIASLVYDPLKLTGMKFLC
jgi:hypothetical protein